MHPHPKCTRLSPPILNPRLCNIGRNVASCKWETTFAFGIRFLKRNWILLCHLYEFLFHACAIFNFLRKTTCTQYDFQTHNVIALFISSPSSLSCSALFVHDFIPLFFFKWQLYETLAKMKEKTLPQLYLITGLYEKYNFNTIHLRNLFNIFLGTAVVGRPQKRKSFTSNMIFAYSITRFTQPKWENRERPIFR